VSSQHDFPYKLTDKKHDLHFDMDDFQRFYFAGEVAPNMMFKLLTEKWKLSEKLAFAVMSL